MHLAVAHSPEVCDVESVDELLDNHSDVDSDVDVHVQLGHPHHYQGS